MRYTTTSNSLPACTHNNNNSSSSRSGKPIVILPCRLSTLGFRQLSSSSRLSAIIANKVSSSTFLPPSKAAIGMVVAKKRMAPRTLRTTPVLLSSSPRASPHHDDDGHQQVCSYYDFDSEDALEQPGLLLPTLITTTPSVDEYDTKKENILFINDCNSSNKRFRLPFRASRPSSSSLSFDTTLGVIPAVPTFDSEEDDKDEAEADRPIGDDVAACWSPRSVTRQPSSREWLEPPAPPSGRSSSSGRHIIDFDSSDLSDDLFMPFSAFD